MAWSLLPVLARLTVRTHSKKQRRKILKRLEFKQTSKMHKVADKAVMVDKEISSIKKEMPALHWDIRKDALKCI